MEEEILTFGGSSKLNLAAALRPRKQGNSLGQHKSKKWASPFDSSSSEEDSSSHVRRKRKRGGGCGNMSLASHLKRCAAELGRAGGESPSPNNESADCIHVDCETSPPVSPVPSPPPLGFYPPKKSNVLSLKVDQILSQLKCPQHHSSPTSEELTLDYSSSSSLMVIDDSLTLRVRCRGKVHRFHVNQNDPLSLLCVELGNELQVSGDRLLLSLHTSTVDVTASPASLSITTADIIDAVVLEKGQSRKQWDSNISNTSLDLADSITIKVQSLKKSIVFRLGKTDPLGKLMTAFSAAVEVPDSQLRFTFDGDPITPTQTPRGLEMDCDDVVDVRILN